MKNNSAVSNETIAYFDKEIFELLSIMETITNASPIKSESLGSVLEMNALELNGPIGDLIETQGDMIHSIRNGSSIGFSDQTGPRFRKFINNIYRTPQIKSKASEAFIKDIAFKWLVDTKRSGQAASNFSSYLFSAIDDSIAEFKIFYQMVCLLLDEPFVVGRVQFGFFTREYFKHFVEQHKANHPNEDNQGYEDLWKKYSGRCFAMLPVSAEIEKAKEIAFKHCGLAVDVLKICSNTMIVPEFECTFEIDQRLSRNTRNEIIVERIANERELSISLYGAGQPFSMHKMQMQQFKERGLDEFSAFLLELEGEQSELQKMIVVAIQRLAYAFTIKDLYYRIAEICSILESLLLVSETGSMIDPVCKYFCRLVHSNPGKRRELDKLYRKIYSVRSAWVHHARKSNFELSDLSFLQQATHALLRVLISKTKKHSTKQTILDEIDEALYNA